MGEQIQTVAHDSLADVVKLTREKLAVILDTKLFDIKYGSKARQCMERRVTKVGSYAYDMAMFFHPIHADLAFIDTMAKMVASGDASYKGESQVSQSKGLVNSFCVMVTFGGGFVVMQQGHPSSRGLWRRRSRTCSSTSSSSRGSERVRRKRS